MTLTPSQLSFADPSLADRPMALTALVVLASLLLSWGLACAVPFAALAAVAALTLTRRQALVLIGLTWFANQAVGFGLLHYPATAETFAWGLVLLLVAVLATVGAEFCATRLGSAPKIAASAFTFVAAFGIYEGLLALVTLASGSDTAVLAPDVVGQIFALNSAAFVVLFASAHLRLARGREKPRAPQSIAPASTKA
jgi:hypothetical protein